MHRLRSTIISSKMLCLKSQFENLALSIIPLFIHLYAFLNKKNQCLEQTLGIFLNIDFISSPINSNMADILDSEGSVVQNDFKN